MNNLGLDIFNKGKIGSNYFIRVIKLGNDKLIAELNGLILEER